MTDAAINDALIDVPPAGVLDALEAQAAAGRGLWCGFFVDVPPIGEYAPEKPPHVTMLHFGRRLPPRRAGLAHRACRVVAAAMPCVTFRPWGIARLDQSRGSVVALALEGEWLEDAYLALARACEVVGVPFDERFAFRPHVTIARIGRDELARVPVMPRLVLRVTELALVCGDAVAKIPLAPADALPF